MSRELNKRSSRTPHHWGNYVRKNMSQIGSVSIGTQCFDIAKMLLFSNVAPINITSRVRRHLIWCWLKQSPSQLSHFKRRGNPVASPRSLLISREEGTCNTSSKPTVVSEVRYSTTSFPVKKWLLDWQHYWWPEIGCDHSLCTFSGSSSKTRLRVLLSLLLIMTMKNKGSLTSWHYRRCEWLKDDVFLR